MRNPKWCTILLVNVLIFQVAESELEGDMKLVKEHLGDPNWKAPDELLIKLVRAKLDSWGCRNQGFILDAFPQTIVQAKGLFTGNK